MNDKKSPFDWNEEYRLFLDSPRRMPPREFSSDIKKAVGTELNPAHWLVLTKLFAIHFVSGTVTLIFCPQFGIGVHAQSELLYGIFRWLGEYGCMIACGAFFLGTTGFFAALLLRVQEVRVIRKSRGLQWALLSFISVGFFLAFQEQEMAIPAGLVVAWIIGALLGGSSVFGLGYLLRSRVRQHVVFRS